MFVRRLSAPSTCFAILLCLSSILASQNPSISPGAFASQDPSISPGSSLPPIEIKTKSIEVVKIQVTKDGWVLDVKNISSKDIVGLSLYTLAKQGDSGRTYIDGKGPLEPLIPVGQVNRVDAAVGGSGFRLPYVTTTERPEQPTIVIGGVAFKDWTFEGDVEAAVTSFPYRRGSQIQMNRIIPLLKRALESPEQDESKVIEQLTQEVSALSEQDNQAGYALAAILSPGSSFVPTEIIRMRLNDSLTRVKEGMLSGLKRYEAERASKGEGLQKWLTERKALYEEMLRKL